MNVQNKERIAKESGIPPLIRLSGSPNASVSVEVRARALAGPRACCEAPSPPCLAQAIAALANLAVNDSNEMLIAQLGGLEPILNAADTSNMDLQSQSARALRNLSVNPTNQAKIRDLNGIPILEKLSSRERRISQQANRALVNLGFDHGGGHHSSAARGGARGPSGAGGCAAAGGDGTAFNSGAGRRQGRAAARAAAARARRAVALRPGAGGTVCRPARGARTRAARRSREQRAAARWPLSQSPFAS